MRFLWYNSSENRHPMPTDLTRLIGLVKTSKLLSDSERKEWLRKMETMNEDQLTKLETILMQAEQINWAEEFPKFEAAVAEAEAVIQSTQFSPSSPFSHARSESVH